MRDDPEFVRWQEGHRCAPGDRAAWWRPWRDVLAGTTGRGVTMRRPRVVSEPLSDRVRYEYDGACTDVAARSARLPLAMDELPYLLQHSPEIPGLLQQGPVRCAAVP